MTKVKLPVGITIGGMLLAAFLLGRPAVQAQGAPPVLNPAQVLGPNVTFTWSPMAGASSYGLQAGIAPGIYPVGLNVGNTSTFSTTAPAIGLYFVRVVALDGGGAVIGASNEISFQVVSMFVPPAAPTNLETFINGTTALLVWNPSTGGGAVTRQILYAGTTPGGSDIGAIPLPAGTTQLSVPGVGAGRYYVRVVAENPGGAGPASNEALIDMPAGGGCSAPPARAFSSLVYGRYVRISWSPVPGVVGYRLDFSQTPGGALIASQAVGPNATSFSVGGVGLGTYYGKLTTAFACGQQSVGPEVALTVDGAPPPGPRTPNPPAGQRLPLPNRLNVVNRVAARFPNEFRASCPTEHRGDTNRFLFELVRELRREDSRWGLNWKRGNRGDMSQDIVTYNFGSEPDEDTTQVYIIDIMFGHCGSNPSPGWIDQTEATRQGGTIGRWTLLPYLDAGFPLAVDQQ